MNHQQRNKRFLGEKKKRNSLKKPKGIFVEVYAVAPAPSRDYYALQLFQKKFSWTKWKICHGPYVAPVQKVVSLKDFKKDVTLQHEMTYIFGEDATNLVWEIANEKWSLTTMPTNVLQKIFSYISVSDILRLSQVSKRLSKECSSNELWKAICKKQWKILIHNDIEKASLIGWKTVYLEKMRPKRYKMDAGHQPKPNFTHRSRVHSVSTLNTPDSRVSLPKSNFTAPKRVTELKKTDLTRSNSEISGKCFRVTSIATGRSSDKTHAINKGKTYREEGKASREKFPLTHLRQSSGSEVFPPGNRTLTEIGRPTKKISPRTNKCCKVTSIRARSATMQTVQPTSTPPNVKSRSERTRPNTGISVKEK